MKLNELITVTGLALLASAQWAQAQDGDADTTGDGELTMMLITDPEAQLPAAVTNRIELPVSASETGRDNSKDGLETANENRQKAQQGLDIAAEARQRGREMSEAAQENRENLVRGNSQENRPNLPDAPNRPENPGPPNPPGPPGP